jgi:hypothetical protein
MQPPPSFLVTMEEYIREAPRANIESKSLVSVFCIKYQEHCKTPEPGGENDNVMLLAIY